MTIKHIEEQIAVLREAADHASASKETAATFLREAGIIGGPVTQTVSRNAKNGQFREHPSSRSDTSAAHHIKKKAK